MKRNTILALLLAFVSPTVAQSWSDTFYDALNDDNLALQRQTLAEWQQAMPDDIDLYIARFNYHIGQATNTSSVIAADSAVLVIDQAIRLFPDRLDLRFGKTYFLGQIKQWQPFADEIIQTLDHSDRINHRWQFPNLNGGGRELMLEGIQDYLYTLADEIDNTDKPTPDDTAIVLHMRRIAHRAAQLFPSDITILKHLAYTHIALADYDNALRHLLRAEKIDPNDPDVLDRLVLVYTKLKNKKLAAQYSQRLKQLYSLLQSPTAKSRP